MGMIWRSTMPLLSTLAALVIIVHSQEEVERGYRRELRPRVVDTASYEQPWKAIDMEPLVQHSTHAEVWNESPEEAPARRRPVRKRKRRPQPYPDAEPQQRHQESIQGTYHDIDYHDSQQTMEITRKRRKRPDINHHFTEEPTNHDERPLRRRGLRRKRPVDYDVPISELMSPEPQDDLRSEKRINNFSKYNGYDDYDDIQRNTEKTKVNSRVESDRPTNTAENADMSIYNRTFGVEEHRKTFGVSDVRLVPAEPESSSGVDENERLRLAHGIEYLKEYPKDDNADIMVMLKKSKVKRLKLGIIINGTEQSYLPLSIPAHEAYSVYDDSFINSNIKTQKYFAAVHANDEERNYFPSSADKDITVSSKIETSKSNSAVNAQFGTNDVKFLHFIIAAKNIGGPNSDKTVLALNNKNPKIFINYVTEVPEYIKLPKLENNVITINNVPKKSNEKSTKKPKEKPNRVISLSQVVKKPKHYHTFSATEKGSTSGNLFLLRDKTEPNYINLPLLSQNVDVIYDILDSTDKPVPKFDKIKNKNEYKYITSTTSKAFASGGHSNNNTEALKGKFDTEYGNKANKYIQVPTEVSKDKIFTEHLENNSARYNSVLFDFGNGDKYSTYFPLPEPTVEVVTKGHSNNKKKLNGALNLGNSYNEQYYFPLSKSAVKVYNDHEHSRKNTESSNSVFDLGYREKELNFFPLPKEAKQIFDENSYSTIINLPLLSQNVDAIYDIPYSTDKPVPKFDKIKNKNEYKHITSTTSKAFASGGHSNNGKEAFKGKFETQYGNTANKYILVSIEVNKDKVFNQHSKNNPARNNSVLSEFGNGNKYSTYFPLPGPTVEVVTKGHSNKKKKLNGALNLGNSYNEQYYFPLSRSAVKVYNDSKHSRKSTESSNSVFDFGYSEKEHSYFPLPKQAKQNINEHSNFTENIEKSFLVINLSPTQNASDLVQKNNTLEDNNTSRKVINTSNGVTYIDDGRMKYSNTRIENDMLYPQKWINTNKWIAKIKLQIPRLTPAELNEFEAIGAEYQENGVLDPLMLKQILKRSNGSSLSEMLQRHNLSLADLLQGKDEAISALNTEVSEEPQLQLNDGSLENTPQLNEAESKYPIRQQSSPEQQKVLDIESNSEETTESTTEIVEAVTETADVVETETPEKRPRISAKRRFPNGIRRKLRMRPTLNSTLKAQLSRDLIALSARKYSRSNKNVTKSREWKDVIPLMADRSKTNDEMKKEDATEPTPTTTETSVDTTVANLDILNTSYSVSNTAETGSIKENEIDNTIVTTTEPTTTIIIELSPSELTERPKVTPIVRPAANNSTLRRQAFNNRLKRKRLKQKSSTTENPNDDLMKNFLGMANLVSASQFIERTQKPYTTVKLDNTEFATELEDFLTTQSPTTVEGDDIKSTYIGTSRFTISPDKSVPQTSITSTTEQSAKFEIEEILNDTMTSERLSRILRERNMTLSELVNHRERGSSHVHLADIFHNASKEPNPPEPFLTKSSIEPISKETYPLRAILEANTHETTIRPASSQADQRNQHIPVVMDFGNNVNENGESMGIISLFNKFADNGLSEDKAELKQDSNGTPYVSSVVSVNATNGNDTNREGKVLTNNEDWKVLLSFMKEHNISTFEQDLQALNNGDTEKESFDDDLDGDGLMVLDDVQHLQHYDSNITPEINENLEVKMFERRENLSDTSGILNKIPSNTKSVAIATASILGLAAILFLLTYIAFKWKQQRDKLKNKLRKKESFCAGPIPSPVFESRKGHKHNCSSRSISPMISNTNIYMSTLDSRNGNESPDYTWNSLRKPFQ